MSRKVPPGIAADLRDEEMARTVAELIARHLARAPGATGEIVVRNADHEVVCVVPLTRPH